MLPKAHLTSHSKMSSSRWVITPSWLSGSLRPFLYSSSVYSYHLLISFASVRSIQFLSYIVPTFAWNVPLVSLIFLKRSLVFPIVCLPLFLCIVHWWRLSYLSLLFFETLHSIGISFLFSLAFIFSYVLSYLQSLLRVPFCLFAFLFLGDGFDQCLLYSIMNLCP